MDYQVRTSATQVMGPDGKHELISTYLNRIYDEQELTNSKYTKIGAINRARAGNDSLAPPPSNENVTLAGHLSPSGHLVPPVSYTAPPVGYMPPPGFINPHVPIGLVPSLLSPGTEPPAGESVPDPSNSMQWTEKLRVSSVTATSPNGRVLSPPREGEKPKWNMY